MAPQTLPIQLTSFIGREDELAEVGSLLRSTRLLTLTGPGGSGKTRLALQAGSEAEDAFRDGVWWVDLASITDPSLVPIAVNETLRVTDVPFRSPSETLRSRLRDDHALIVLDNCEHVIEACAELVDEILRFSPGTSVLATSREPLRVEGEVSWPVPPLGLPPAGDDIAALMSSESVRLFVDRATRVRPNFRLEGDNRAAVVEICRRLEGIPLAIELAAARTRVLAPDRIASGLSDAFHVLGGGTRTSAPRQQTLRASVDWSHELLEEPERVLLRRLSVFSGGFTLDAAEEVCSGDGLEAMDVLDLISNLVEKSLAWAQDSAGGARYRVLETIRQYGVERLREAGEEDRVRGRHLEHFKGIAAQAWEGLDRSEATAWLDRLDAEHDNLRSALGWSATRYPDAHLRLAAMLWSYWGARHLIEGRRRLEAALALDTTDEEARGWALFGLSIICANLFDLAASRSLAEEALAVSRASGDRGTEAAALSQLGWAGVWIEGERARIWFDRSIRMAREIDDSRTLSIALNGLGFLEFQSGRPGEARRVLEEALDVAEHNTAGSLSPLRGIHGWLGLTLLLHGDLAEAEERLIEALKGDETVGGVTFRTLWRSGLGLVATFQGRYDDARSHLRDALELIEEFPLGTSVPLWFSGCLEYWTNDLAAARVTLELAMERLLAAGETVKWGVSMCQGILGHIAWLEGDRDEGKRRLDEALEVARSAGIAAGMEIALALRGVIAQREGDHERAEALFLEGGRIGMEAGGRPWVADGLEGMGCLAAEQESFEEAARLFGAAEAMRDSMGYVRFPVYSEAFDADVALAREGLGDERFAAAWAEGRGMSMEQAVTYASKRRGPRRRPATGWASLTPVERRVAELVAERLTNPQIAERLFVSRGTVKTHLSHIYTKLAISSRLELADQVLERRESAPG